jgi:hypothetical protein
MSLFPTREQLYLSREYMTDALIRYAESCEKEMKNAIYNCLSCKAEFQKHPELHSNKLVSTAVLKRFPECLQYIQNPTKEQCDAAFGSNAYAIEWIPDSMKTEDMCEKAVETNADFLKFVPVHFLTPNLYTELIQKNPTILQFIPCPTFDILEKALDRNETMGQRYGKQYSMDLWSYISSHWKNDSFYTWVRLHFPSQVAFPNEEFKMCLRMLALYRNPEHIQYLSESTEFEWLTILKEKPGLLKNAPEYIRVSPTIQDYVIHRDPKCLEFCIHPSKDICLAAVQRNGNALQYVSQEMQSEHPEIVKTALKQTKDALPFAKIALAEHPATWICGTHATSELQFPEASETLRRRSLEDPDTLEPLQKGEVYGFWVDENKRWYVAGSRTMFRRYIETQYKGTTIHHVYVPLLKNVMNVQNLKWVVW